MGRHTRAIRSSLAPLAKFAGAYSPVSGAVSPGLRFSVGRCSSRTNAPSLQCDVGACSCGGFSRGET